LSYSKFDNDELGNKNSTSNLTIWGAVSPNS
jgi:hypothetical protein